MWKKNPYLYPAHGPSLEEIRTEVVESGQKSQISCMDESFKIRSIRCLNIGRANLHLHHLMLFFVTFSPFVLAFICALWKRVQPIFSKDFKIFFKYLLLFLKRKKQMHKGLRVRKWWWILKNLNYPFKIWLLNLGRISTLYSLGF